MQIGPGNKLSKGASNTLLWLILSAVIGGAFNLAGEYKSIEIKATKTVQQ